MYRELGEKEREREREREKEREKEKERDMGWVEKQLEVAGGVGGQGQAHYLEKRPLWKAS
jgi:hypothetical protein